MALTTTLEKKQNKQLSTSIAGKNTVEEALSALDTGKSSTSHTHNYAGSDSAGGAANSAKKLTNTAAIGSATKPVYFTANGVPTACTYSLNKDVPSNAVFTDSHYTTKLYVTGSTGTTNAQTSNGATYLRLFDDTTNRSSINIKGTGATTVSSDSNGVITINSTDTNTHNSHKINSGKKSDDTTDIMSSSASSGDITLGDSGVIAGEYGDTSDQSPSYGSKFKVPTIHVNTKGIITEITTHTVQIPNSDNTNTSHTHKAGVGLTGSGSSGTSGEYTYKVNLVNETKSSNASSYTAGGTTKFYAVQLDKNDKLGVYVPWTDTHLDLNDINYDTNNTINVGTLDINNGITFNTSGTIQELMQCISPSSNVIRRSINLVFTSVKQSGNALGKVNSLMMTANISKTSNSDSAECLLVGYFKVTISSNDKRIYKLYIGLSNSTNGYQCDAFKCELYGTF